jgi:hypothetical protein
LSNEALLPQGAGMHQCESVLTIATDRRRPHIEPTARN